MKMILLVQLCLLLTFLVGAVRTNESLLIAFNTMKRPNVDYLSETVYGIVDQINDFRPSASLRLKTAHLLVRDIGNEESVQRLHGKLGDAVYFVRGRRSMDPYVNHTFDPAHGATVSPRARQLTLDFIDLALDAYAYNTADYVMLHEDDASMCSGALVYVAQALEQVRVFSRCQQPPCFSMLRTGKCGMGILFPRENLLKVARYAHRYYLGRPADWLVGDWANGNWPLSVRRGQDTYTSRPPPILPHETANWTVFGGLVPPDKRFFTARNLLFEHKGLRSTIIDEKRVDRARCGSAIGGFVQEKFRSECRAYFVSPCRAARRAMRPIGLHSGVVD